MKSWTKKDKIACIIIFVMAVITTVVFVSSITLSYLFDTHSVNSAITAGLVDFKFTGGPNNDGKIQFPATISPNTIYSGTNYTFTITNTSTSGAIFIYVKVEANDYVRALPASTTWLGSTTNNNYYFYKAAVSQNTSVTFCTKFKTLDFGNTNAGEKVTVTLTVGAVQSQGGACTALINSSVDGWENAPTTFKNFVASYTG